MRYSKLFGKTQRNVSQDMKMVSHKLLFKAGFVRESTSGRYYFLPLGMRVMNKITNIIREEMDAAGSQEMVTPVLHPLELWQETNRTNETGFELLKVTDRRGLQFVLGGTGEEMVTELVRKYQLSYKDLPFNIYQFSSKFRDEIRVKGGLLRVREFTMKDAYSFDRDEEAFKKEYKNMWDTYTKIFDRLGLSTTPVLADNGYIGGEYCHEFVVNSSNGESIYFVTEGGNYCAHRDIAKFDRKVDDSATEELPMKIIEQPKWVMTMEDNLKHYNVPKYKFLKNVVYKNRVTQEIIIAVIRGDLEVNMMKLEHVLNAVGQLEDATDEDLEKLGTKSGYVHCWGHKGARYIGDISLTSVKNFIGGQKEDETDSINVNYGRDFTCEMLADIATAKEGYISENGEKLVEKRGIEVGNIFQLGYHYTNLMKGSVFVDNDGKEKKYYMGCYGIGLGRTMATIVENHNDEKGIIWPENIAPYKVHLIHLGKEFEKEASDLYNELSTKGIEVLWDDREDVSTGEKLNDADLIGIPYRVVISKKSKENGGYEVKKRDEKEVFYLDLSKLLNL